MHSFIYIIKIYKNEKPYWIGIKINTKDSGKKKTKQNKKIEKIEIN